MEKPATTESLNAQLLTAWWNLAQVMKRHIVPTLQREHGMDFRAYVALAAINDGANYPRLMCERLGVPPSGVSRMLEELAGQGFVRRSLDPHDSRRVRLEITPKGEAVLQASRATMLGLLDQGLAPFPPQQVRQFVQTLQQLGESLASVEPPPRAPGEQEQ